MNLSYVGADRAVGTRPDANGKFRRAPDYTVNTFPEYLKLAQTHVGVFTVKVKREVSAEIAAQAESLLNVYGKSSIMSGRPYKKVLLARVESDKWNNGYGISQIAENGAPINGLTRFQTHAESTKDYLVFTLSFGADANDYFQFDETQSVRTNEDHYRTLGYSQSEAQFLSGVKLAANSTLSKANKIISRDQEVNWYDGHKEDVDFAKDFMNTLLEAESVPYKEAFYALILAKGILNKVDGTSYLNLISNVIIDGRSSSKWEAKFKSLFDLLKQKDVKKASVWSTLRKAAEFTLAATEPYDVVIVRPKNANTKESVKLIPGAWKAPEDTTKPKAKAKVAKAGK